MTVLNTWTNGTLYPRSIGWYTRNEGQVGNVLYMLGGQQISPSIRVSEVWKYDMENDIWAQLNDCPYGQMAYQDSCVVGNYIYSYGGYQNVTWPSTILSRYDTVNDTWSLMANNSAALELNYYWPTLISNGIDVYVLGGWNSVGWTYARHCYKYTVSSNTWTRLADAPTEIYGAEGMFIDSDNIRIFGGLTGPPLPNDYGNTLNMNYRISTNSWDNTTYAPVPSKGGFGHIARFDNYIYYIGRYGLDVPPGPGQKATEVYDIVSDSWFHGTDMPVATNGGSTGVYNGKVYCIATTSAIPSPYKVVQVYSSLQAVDAPENPVCTPGPWNNTITWTYPAPAPNIIYNIYWSFVPGVSVSDTKIAGVTSPYIHPSLTHGVTYYYIITAYNTDISSESDPSVEISGTPSAAVTIAEIIW